METAQREAAITDARRKEQDLRMKAAEATRIAGVTPHGVQQFASQHVLNYRSVCLHQAMCTMLHHLVTSAWSVHPR